MKISKKRLRDIIVEDIVENALFCDKTTTGYLASCRTELIVESLKKGRRIRSLPWSWWMSAVVHTIRNLGRKGFELEVGVQSGWEFAPDDRVKIKLFSEGQRNTWVFIPKDIAEKILVFGVVPSMIPETI